MLRNPFSSFHPFTGVLIGVTSLSTDLAAQQECVTRTDIDEFTRERRIEVAPLSYGGGIRFHWQAVDGRCYLHLEWQRQGNEEMVVLEHDTLLLKLENDSVLTFTSDLTVTSVPVLDASGVRAVRADYRYPLTEHQLKLLMTYWVQKVRIYCTDGYEEYAAIASPLWQRCFSRSAECLLSALHEAPVPSPNAVIGERR
jgi:hypothetical protein